MRLDKNQNPDVCRTASTPMSMAARVATEQFKLQMNAILHSIARLHDCNPDPQIKRLLVMGFSELEVGATLVVKAMTSEGLRVTGAPDERPTDHPSKEAP